VRQLHRSIRQKVRPSHDSAVTSESAHRLCTARQVKQKAPARAGAKYCGQSSNRTEENPTGGHTLSQKNGTLVRPKNICAAPLKRHFRGYVVEDQRPRAGDESARQVTVSDVGGSRESSRRLTFRMMPHGGYRSAPSVIAALAGFVQD